MQNWAEYFSKSLHGSVFLNFYFFFFLKISDLLFYLKVKETNKYYIPFSFSFQNMKKKKKEKSRLLKLHGSLFSSGLLIFKSLSNRFLQMPKSTLL